MYGYRQALKQRVRKLKTAYNETIPEKHNLRTEPDKRKTITPLHLLVIDRRTDGGSARCGAGGKP